MVQGVAQLDSSAIGQDCISRSQTKQVTAYLSLGSNMGERETQLHQAVELLAQHPALELRACSSVYQTKPYGPIAQEPFWNLCLKLSVDEQQLVPTSEGIGEAAEALLRFCLQCELQLGRDRSPQNLRWGPRCIDIDLIDYNFLHWHSPSLHLPHPHFLERLFVLVPLVEIADQTLLQTYAVTRQTEHLQNLAENSDWGYRVCAPPFVPLLETSTLK